MFLPAFLSTEFRPRLYKIDSPNVGLLYESSTFRLQCGDVITKATYLYKLIRMYKHAAASVPIFHPLHIVSVECHVVRGTRVSVARTVARRI
jgi:hypothetical protein